jgi:hypothetical protein
LIRSYHCWKPENEKPVPPKIISERNTFFLHRITMLHN